MKLSAKSLNLMIKLVESGAAKALLDGQTVKAKLGFLIQELKLDSELAEEFKHDKQIEFILNERKRYKPYTFRYANALEGKYIKNSINQLFKIKEVKMYLVILNYLDYGMFNEVSYETLMRDYKFCDTNLPVAICID